jgi:hypothetical protein
MMHWVQLASILCVLISYLSSLRAFRLDMPLLFKQFSYFLLFVLLGELFGIAWPRWIYKLTPFGQTNAWFYNLFHICLYSFYLYFFFKILRSTRLKKTIMILFAVYLALAVTDLFIQGLPKFNNYITVFVSFMMVFLSIVYYYQLLRSQEVILLRNDMAFWICTGLLIHHLGSAVGLFLIDLMNYYSDVAAQKVHRIIMGSAAVMYLTYSIGYLCHKKQ